MLVAMVLSKMWEGIPVVRKRFRIGSDWVHRPVNSKGQEVVQTTQALQANWRVLCCIVQHLQLEKLALKPIQKQAIRICLLQIFCCGHVNIGRKIQ